MGGVTTTESWVQNGSPSPGAWDFASDRAKCKTTTQLNHCLILHEKMTILKNRLMCHLCVKTMKLCNLNTH